MKVIDPHIKGLHKAATLTGFQVMDAINPHDVIKVLNANGVSFVLVGAYGLVGWTKDPRATEDVDLVIAARHQKKAARHLLDEYPHLEAKDHEVVTRLADRESGDVAIDLMKPNQPLYREVFKHTHPISTAKQQYRVPCLEMALAMKFAAMISLTRSDEKKHMDAHDFIRMVRVNPEIDSDRLAALGELVYAGGGQEIAEKVRQVRAGETLRL
ncbi:MAG: hypothetical protein FJ271_00670 [Planctomycetes bacterium]|nr:hypothetical protein [Planctomycetota bacterium]